jgi:hypothetical protein
VHSHSAVHLRSALHQNKTIVWRTDKLIKQVLASHNFVSFWHIKTLWIFCLFCWMNPLKVQPILGSFGQQKSPQIVRFGPQNSLQSSYFNGKSFNQNRFHTVCDDNRQSSWKD